MTEPFVRRYDCSCYSLIRTALLRLRGFLSPFRKAETICRPYRNEWDLYMMSPGYDEIDGICFTHPFHHLTTDEYI